MHCMLMDLLHGFEVLSTTEETLFNSRNVSRLMQKNAKLAVTSAEAKQELRVPMLLVQLTSLIKFENCEVSPLHTVHHIKPKRYLAASLLLCLLAK